MVGLGRRIRMIVGVVSCARKRGLAPPTLGLAGADARSARVLPASRLVTWYRDDGCHRPDRNDRVRVQRVLLANSYGPEEETERMKYSCNYE